MEDNVEEQIQQGIKSSEKEPTILKIKNLTKKFEKIVAVNDVSFEVKRGEILGIIGANGSGKTTLFNMISGVHKPTRGKIYAMQKSATAPQIIKRGITTPFTLLKQIIYGKREKIQLNGKTAVDIGGMREDIILNEFGIARTFQIVRPFKLLTAEENVTVPHVPRKLLTSPGKLKSSGIRSLLEVDLGEKKNYPGLILPHGDLKRLDIARALACDPKIILLDEPYSGLSSEDAFRITQLIKRTNKEFGVTIMIVEHKLKFLANLVTRIIVLDQGSVLAIGTPKEISENQNVISAYLGTEASHIA